MEIINVDFDSLINTLDNHDTYFLNNSETLLITKIHNSKLFKDWLNSKGIVLEYKSYHSAGNKQYKGHITNTGDELVEHFITIAVMKNNMVNKSIKLTCCNSNIANIDDAHFTDINSAGFALNGSFFFINTHITSNIYDIKTNPDGSQMTEDEAIIKFTNQPIGFYKHLYNNYGVRIPNHLSRKSNSKPFEDPRNDITGFKQSLKFAEDIMGILRIKPDNNCEIIKVRDFIEETIDTDSQYLTGNILIQNGRILFDESLLGVVYNMKENTNYLNEIPDNLVLRQFTKCVLCDVNGNILNIDQIENIINNSAIFIAKISDIIPATNTVSQYFTTIFNEEEIFMPYHTKLISQSGVDFAGKIPPAMPLHGSDLNPRSCAFIDANNNVFFMNVEGRQYYYGGVGLDLFQLAQLCKAMGAVNMINLDGGGSASLSWKEAGNHNSITTDYDVIESTISKRDTYNVSNFIVVSENIPITTPLATPLATPPTIPSTIPPRIS
jgi:hypothetical protein